MVSRPCGPEMEGVEFFTAPLLGQRMPGYYLALPAGELNGHAQEVAQNISTAVGALSEVALLGDTWDDVLDAVDASRLGFAQVTMQPEAANGKPPDPRKMATLQLSTNNEMSIAASSGGAPCVRLRFRRWETNEGGPLSVFWLPIAAASGGNQGSARERTAAYGGSEITYDNPVRLKNEGAPRLAIAASVLGEIATTIDNQSMAGYTARFSWSGADKPVLVP